MENSVESQNTSPINEVDKIVSDEILRAKIRKLIEDKPKNKWEFLKHPLLTLIIGFALTTLVGTYLTNQYTAKQKDKERESSFQDEINKTRIAKIGEVWEKVYELEHLSDQLVERYKTHSMLSEDYSNYFISFYNSKTGKNEQKRKDRFFGISRELYYDSSRKLGKFQLSVNDKLNEVDILATRNRFWIGERVYQDLQEYLRLDKELCSMPLGNGTDHPEFSAKEFDALSSTRNKARKSIIDIRQRVFTE